MAVLAVNFLCVGWVYKARLEPLISSYEKAAKEAEKAIKTGMSAMGTRSGEVRNQKAFDREMGESILGQYPEVELVLDMLSPDMAEKIREDPTLALNWMNRYGHLLGINKNGVKTEVKKYDL